MHAWLCEDPSGVDALTWKEIPTPRPKAGEVLYYREGASATVSVKRLTGTTTLAVDGKTGLATPIPNAILKVSVPDLRSRLAKFDEQVKKAKDAAEKVRRWGDVVELEPMNAFDRRIVHQALRDDPGVETHSVEVEGTEKKAILLRPKH